jgi:CheY-like chemotaxis protein
VGETAGARVLFVDDESALLEVGRQVLERGGFKVAAFASPQEAAEVFRANPEGFDLLITDFNMPGMSGFQVAEQVLKLRPNLPVLVASGFLQPEQIAAVEAMGTVRVLLKPYSAEALCQSAWELLPGKAGAGPR